MGTAARSIVLLLLLLLLPPLLPPTPRVVAEKQELEACTHGYASCMTAAS